MHVESIPKVRILVCVVQAKENTKTSLGIYFAGSDGRNFGCYTTSIPFGYILLLVESTSKAFRILTKVLQGLSPSEQKKNPLSGICSCSACGMMFELFIENYRPFNLSLSSNG